MAFFLRLGAFDRCCDLSASKRAEQNGECRDENQGLRDYVLLGIGGMGEVYRARDAKLGRDVAIKVLQEAFARDVERMARFQREAKVLASLNHPNIAAIYGFEDSRVSGGQADGAHALVMELVEGPTLAEKRREGDQPNTCGTSRSHFDRDANNAKACESNQ